MPPPSPSVRVWASLDTAPAFATEGGAPTTPFGVFEFGAGILPPTTPYGTVGLRTNFYSASSVKDGSGNTRLSDFHLHVLSIGAAYIKMTETEFRPSVGKACCSRWPASWKPPSPGAAGYRRSTRSEP